MTSIIEKIKATPVDVVWRHAKSICVAVGVIWASIWWIGGDFIEAQAQQALVEMLTQQGMAPEDFRAAKRNIAEIAKDLDGIGSDAENTSRAVASISKDVDQMQQQLLTLNQQMDRNYDLLKTILPMMKTEAITP